MKKKLGYKWFDFYTSVMPIGLVLMVIIFISNFCNYYVNNNENLLLTFVFVFDLIYCILSINVYIDIEKKAKKAIKKLCFLLLYNWIYKTILSVLMAYIGGTDIDLGVSALCFIIFSVYYIPNIVYFYKRKDWFLNYNEEDLIKESDEEAEKFIRELREKNNADTIISCKICGKQIPYNENETCEECHKIILERIESKKHSDSSYTSKFNIISNSNLSQSQKGKLMKEIDLMSEKDITDIISKYQNYVEEAKQQHIKEQYSQMYCVNCGKPLQDDWKFCNYCGNKLK